MLLMSSCLSMALIELPCFWLPLFILTAALIASSIFITETPQGLPVHGIRGRTTFNESCLEGQRGAFDTTFLACEDATFWLVVHIVSVYILHFFLGDPRLSAALAFGWEAIEGVALIYTGSFIIYKSTPDQFETAAGALIADALLCGMLGLALGELLRRYSGFPGLVPLVLEQKKSGFEEWNGYRMTSGRAIGRYLGAVALVGINFLYAGFATDSGILYGAYIALTVLTIELLFIVPLLIRTGDALFVDLGAAYARAKWLLVATILLISMGAIGFEFLANNFFQSWLFYYGAIVLVFAAAIVREQISRFRRQRTASAIKAKNRAKRLDVVESSG